MTALDRFDTFWRAYPRKRDKGHARRVFMRLRVDDDLLAKMLAALEQQKKSSDWQRDGGQYIPYPGTWLMGERWEDVAGPVKLGNPHETTQKCYICSRYRRESEMRKHPQYSWEWICRSHQL